MCVCVFILCFVQGQRSRKTQSQPAIERGTDRQIDRQVNRSIDNPWIENYTGLLWCGSKRFRLRWQLMARKRRRQGRAGSVVCAKFWTPFKGCKTGKTNANRSTVHSAEIVVLQNTLCEVPFRSL